MVDTEEIAKSLCVNQNIYGFHFEGNNEDWVVDTIGFLTKKSEF